MWDQRYAEEGFAYGTEPNDFLVASMHLVPAGGRILCLAEGEGRNGVFLAQNGFRVECVDSSTVGLAKARTLAESRSVSIDTEVADLSSYVIEDNAYDGIISIFCHLPPPVQETIHRQIYPGLKEGGVFILEGYSKKQIEYDTGGPRKKELLMDLESIQHELHPLDLTDVRETIRPIHEGVYHNGPGVVVQVIGIKRSVIKSG